MNMKKYNFGFAIRKLRTDRGIEQKEFAKMVGISYSMLNMMENGKRNNPGSQQLARIADSLKITKQYIFDLAELAPENYKIE